MIGNNKKLIIGDIHFSVKNKLYFEHILFPLFIEMIKKYDFDEVVFLGDIFHSSSINNDVSKLFKKLLNIFKNKTIKIINGNHDKISLTENVYDILLLPKNVKIYDELTFEDNFIYLPHVDKNLNKLEIFETINSYIENSNYEEYYIYSHNDYNEIYSFKNQFVSINDILDTPKNVYLINGHNHVPIFKELENIKVLNIGAAMSLDYKDSGLYNYFILINDEIKILYNKDALQYITIDIKDNDDIEKSISKLSNNLKYIKFKIHDPTISISKDDIFKLDDNILDIIVEYELSTFTSNVNNLANDKEQLYDLMEKLNISVDEFIEFNDADNIEKINVLFSILDIMFEARSTEEENKIEVVNIIKKYLKHEQE